jgi:hypothetical protein
MVNGAHSIKLTMDNKSVMCGKGDIPTYSGENLKSDLRICVKKQPANGWTHTHKIWI